MSILRFNEFNLIYKENEKMQIDGTCKNQGNN